jgi:hypothetical protein
MSLCYVQERTDSTDLDLGLFADTLEVGPSSSLSLECTVPFSTEAEGGGVTEAFELAETGVSGIVEAVAGVAGALDRAADVGAAEEGVAGNNDMGGAGGTAFLAFMSYRISKQRNEMIGQKKLQTRTAYRDQPSFPGFFHTQLACAH